ncbi:hypothetical protein AK812_SmicGene48246, partial [Symbiodinium microadriaticum]
MRFLSALSQCLTSVHFLGIFAAFLSLLQWRSKTRRRILPWGFVGDEVFS